MFTNKSQLIFLCEPNVNKNRFSRQNKMKDLPLDVKLLRLGLNYAHLRANKEDFWHLFEVKDAGDMTSEVTSVHNSVYNNLSFVQAMNLENPPRVAMKFNEYEESLLVDKVSGKITKAVIGGQKVPVEAIEVPKVKGLTSLDLLSTVMPFAIADALCDVDYHRCHMADEIEAFGQKGADNVEKFKTDWLGEQKKLGLPAYKLEDPFEAHLDSLEVTLGFECIIKGREGKGTDYVYVNGNKLLTKIIVIRDIK